jgi:hypothetical protein
MSQISLIYELLSETTVNQSDHTVLEHDVIQDKEEIIKTDAPRPTTLEYPKSSMHRDQHFDRIGDFYAGLKKQESIMEIIDL